MKLTNKYTKRDKENRNKINWTSHWKRNERGDKARKQKETLSDMYDRNKHKMTAKQWNEN